MRYERNDEMKYEIAILNETDGGEAEYEHFDDCRTREEAVAILRQQVGNFALGEVDAGHYREFFRHDRDGNLLVSDTGAEGTFARFPD